MDGMDLDLDLNLNLSPPPTPHLGLALGLGVGPAPPVSAAPVNDDEGSIPGRLWPRQFQEIGRYRSRHRWRGQFRRVLEGSPIPPPSESLSPHSELEQRNPHAETLKDNPGTDTNASNFECNICLEMARDPVVTSCGHLFCWACLYQWLHVHSTSKECPVCKGEVTDPNITPIYGRSNSDHAGTMTENGEKIPPRPRANRIESLRQRRPISRRFMEAIRLTRRRETQSDNRVHVYGGARQDEASTTAQGVDNFIGAAADEVLNSFSVVHFERQRARSSDDRWQMRQLLARRSLARPNAHSPLDVDDRLRSPGEGETESIWGHLQFGRPHRSERAVESLGNEQGLVSDSNRERASLSSTNAMILTGSRPGDAAVEQDSGISSSFQRRRHVPSCSDSDGGLLNARKRRRLN